MPFTLFHFGPGLAAAVATRRIDFWAFAAANVLIDLESGWHLWQRQYPVHRFLHSFVGASLMILPAALVAIGVTAVAARCRLPVRRAAVVSALVGASLGAWSHVILDALMHADQRPLAPWSDANPLLGLVSLRALLLFCVACGIGGLLAIAWRGRRPPAA